MDFAVSIHLLQPGQQGIIFRKLIVSMRLLTGESPGQGPVFQQ
ncbi:hypothetical protein [Spirosoma aerophilum]